MEAVCRKILGLNETKPARWGLQRTFPTQRKRQAFRNLNANMNARPRPSFSLAKKRFEPMLTRKNNTANKRTKNKYPPLPPSPISISIPNNNYSTISSLNNMYGTLPPSPVGSINSLINTPNTAMYPALPASPVGSVNSRYTANTENTVNGSRGGRRRKTRRH